MRLLFALFALGSVFANAAVAGAAPTAQEIVTQARAKLGSEKNLKAVKTLLFEAKSYDANGKEFGFIQIQYKAPNKRREYILREKGSVEVLNGTDGLEAYEKLAALTTQETQIRILGNTEVAIFKDYIDLDMGFYAEPPRGKLIYVGEGKQQDINCHILDYHYAGGLKLRRYFDKSTSLLVAQEISSSRNENAPKRLVVEEGSIIEGGIRFPKKSIIYLQDKETKEYKKDTEIEFTKIVVNGDIPDSVFAFPMP